MEGVSPVLAFLGAQPAEKVKESDRRTGRLASYDDYLKERQQFDQVCGRWHATKTLIDRLLIAYKVHTTEGDMSDEARRVPRALFGRDVLTASTKLAPSAPYPASQHPGDVLDVANLLGELNACGDIPGSVMGSRYWHFRYGIERLVRELKVAFPLLEAETAA